MVSFSSRLDSWTWAVTGGKWLLADDSDGLPGSRLAGAAWGERGGSTVGMETGGTSESGEPERPDGFRMCPNEPARCMLWVLILMFVVELLLLLLLLLWV